MTIYILVYKTGHLNFIFMFQLLYIILKFCFYSEVQDEVSNTITQSNLQHLFCDVCSD